MRKRAIVLSIFVSVLFVNPVSARFLGDLNPTGRDGWANKTVQKTKKEAKRVKDKVDNGMCQPHMDS